MLSLHPAFHLSSYVLLNGRRDIRNVLDIMVCHTYEDVDHSSHTSLAIARQIRVVSSIHTHFYVGARDSVDGIATRYELDGPGIESRWRRNFLCRSDSLQGTPSLLYKGYRVFPGLKRPKRGADHPPPSSVGLRVGSNCTSASALYPHRHITG